MAGLYQKDIDELPELENYRYENIFKVYQTGEKNFYYYNILKKVTMPDNVDSSYFNVIKLQNNIPLTTLSYQLYNTIHLWWLILIVNKIDNPIRDLPYGKDIRVVKQQFIPLVVNLITDQL